VRAIVQDVYGGPEVLRLSDDVPEPVIGGGKDVLVKVHAAGLDQGVWHLMTGKPLPARLMFGLRVPKTPIRGWDVAGHVVAVGPEVSRLTPGQAVFGSCDGSFADFVVTTQDTLAAAPAGITLAHAASLPISAVTALQALRDGAELKPGQTVLVLGAGGGVGSFAVQLAKADGAHVTGVCSTAKTDFVTSLGADDVIDYTRDDVTRGSGRYDVIVDTAGHRPLADLRRVLTPKGTILFVGAEVPGLMGGMGRQLAAAARSPFVGQSFKMPMAKVTVPDLEKLAALVDSGAVRPPVTATYPLAQVPEAIADLRAARIKGKAVILVEESADR
jgi:NADPH:quinone reductase-like Zn-dependent oxidoreductase